MLEGGLNKDIEATSISCRMLGDDGNTEEKYYLRHDESKVSHISPIPSGSQRNRVKSQAYSRTCLHSLCCSAIRTSTITQHPGSFANQVRNLVPG